SDFIAIGIVIQSHPVPERLSNDEIVKLDDLSKTLGGVLYTFQVEKVLCSRADLTPDVRKAPASSERFFIFKIRDTRFFQEEIYQERQRYLIFLTSIPNQNQLLTQYRLEKGRIYYQALEGGKGLIPLSSDEMPLLNKVKQFCEAISPSSPHEKIRRLSNLAVSSDPELRQSAIEAIKIIQKNMSR
ncbi:MAG TPA: hypothetical protein VNO14_04475, partial [Blastocatellia bacterium]|nr:hypothetical protein [Blastocatellia bacterium]